ARGPASTNPKKGGRTATPRAGRLLPRGPPDPPPNAVPPPAGLDALHRPGRIDGLAAAGRGPEGHALRAAECPHHAPSAVGRLPGPGDRHHAARSGDPEPEEAAQ